MSRPLRIEYPGAYYHVMNPDVILTPTYLEKAIEGMRSDMRIGAVKIRGGANLYP